ncbi:hypothetical protein [Spongiactinospora sp. 9N601]|uniref:hypothetical protein n=1 Tax=Spongiactinospora sp. 9N601 TaxID=3375149 RepID=UPI0037B63848
MGTSTRAAFGDLVARPGRYGTASMSARCAMNSTRIRLKCGPASGTTTVDSSESASLHHPNRTVAALHRPSRACPIRISTVHPRPAARSRLDRNTRTTQAESRRTDP